MIGLAIAYNNQILNIASDANSGIMIVKRDEELYFDVSGIDRNSFITQWVKNAKLEAGDKIVVSVKEILRITEPVKRFPFEKMDEETVAPAEDQMQLMYREKLARFHALEKKLKEEGLI